MAVASSVCGLLAMLNEEDDNLKVHALRKLNTLIDLFWPEISTRLRRIETLYKDYWFRNSHRRLAALVVSKVYYYLGDLNDSLLYAHAAGPMFDVTEDSDYAHTLFATALNKYATLKSKNYRAHEEDFSIMRSFIFKTDEQASGINPMLESMIERMMDKCISDGKYQQAMAIAVECRRLDKLEQAITSSNTINDTLSYCINHLYCFVYHKEYRFEILLLLVKILLGLSSPDYINICQYLLILNKPHTVVAILETLLRSGSKDDDLLAFQIAFDIVENEHQAFLLCIIDRLRSTDYRSTIHPGKSIGKIFYDENNGFTSDFVERTHVPESSEVAYNLKLDKITRILSGEISIQLTSQFLYSHNRSDLLILKSIKQSVEMRNSVCHSATISANAIMHAGTTVDTFLRENLEWLSGATNWAKFSATASLGVIYKGHLKQGRALMAPYLPQTGVACGGSPYSEGGALYALGLIHTCHGEGVEKYLRKSLKKNI